MLDDDDKFKERQNNLTLFKKMIFKLKELDNAKEDNKIGLSVSIVQHANLPRKPKNDESRSTWKKAFLENGITPRQYIIAHISSRSKNFYAIEIERSSSDEKIAVWIVYKKSEAVHTSTMNNIMRHYVKSNGRWEFEQVDSNLKSFHINHVGTEDDMAERLYKRINGMLKQE